MYLLKGGIAISCYGFVCHKYGSPASRTATKEICGLLADSVEHSLHFCYKLGSLLTRHFFVHSIEDSMVLDRWEKRCHLHVLQSHTQTHAFPSPHPLMTIF